MNFIELTHPVAMLLLAVAFALMIIIILLGHTVLGAIDLYKEKIKKTTKTVLVLAGIFYSSEAAALAPASIVPGLSDTILWLMLSALVTELLVILVLMHVLRFLTEIRLRREAWGLSFAMVALIGYLVVFQFTEASSPKASAAPIAEKQVDNIDEHNVLLLTDAADIAEGRKIFLSKCAVCHGGNGQGMVGPNLTDDYWLHGGKVNEIFSTIKYGVPEKGMQSWKNLSGQQIARLTGYIRSIRGSAPADAKPPEGEPYSE